MTLGLSTLTTGFPTLDAALGGLRPDDLIILGSRPGMCKSELCLQIATHIAQQGQIAAYISLYQSQEEITQQILAVTARVPLFRLKSGDISPTEKQHLAEKMSSLPELPLWIDAPLEGTTGMTLETLQTQLTDLKQQQELSLGVVIVDYLQLIGDGEPAAPEDVIPTLQKLTRELNCPILGISQLSRRVEDRITPRPTLFDLKDHYPTIDQDADVIVLLNRPQQVQAPIVDESVELIVSRKDHSKATTLALRLDHELHCFWEPSEDRALEAKS